jgi:hypothetical protein
VPFVVTRFAAWLIFGVEIEGMEVVGAERELAVLADEAITVVPRFAAACSTGRMLGLCWGK